MIYRTAHEARRRIQEQSKDIAEMRSSLDKSIETIQRINDVLDRSRYSDKKYKKRKFVHKVTGFEYELNHFVDFDNYRKRIKQDYKDYMLPALFTAIMIVSTVSFIVFMMTKD